MSTKREYRRPAAEHTSAAARHRRAGTARQPEAAVARRQRVSTTSLCCAALLLCLLGCPPRDTERPAQELQTQDLGAGPTDQLRPEGDARENRSFSGPAGAVPADFPSDLPLPPAASVAGFGALSESRRYLDVDLEARRPQVEQWLQENWAAWSKAGERWSNRRDGRWIEISFSERQFGSRLRIDYPARVLD